jgi:hypothetical protein
MHIRDALKEEERENVGLEIGSVHGAAEDVGRLPEMGLQHA